jgi:hypothetical protein
MTDGRRRRTPNIAALSAIAQLGAGGAGSLGYSRTLFTAATRATFKQHPWEDQPKGYGQHDQKCRGAI